MEKIIKCKMNTNKSISIILTSEIEDKKEITITVENRQISAKELYDLFNFNYGDHYTVTETENENSIDVDVLNFFNDMIKEIAGQLNNIEHENNGE